MSQSSLWTSLDPYVDVHALRALDEPMQRQLAELGRRFPVWPTRFVSWYTEHLAPADKPKALYLSFKQNCATYSDLMRDQRGFTPTPEAALFPELNAFISTLPLAVVGRILVIFDELGLDTPPHFDHIDPTWHQEFIWFRPNLVKGLYFLRPDSDERHPITGHAAWFDTGRIRHGVEGRPGFAISIRVDGIFTDAFRATVASLQGESQEPS